jgi:copper oxidase (laccase) domain-containing protein
MEPERMPFKFHKTIDPNRLQHTRYGFFTNEQGSSAGGYVVNGEGTRNVNLYSPQESDKPGYDPARSVVSNLMSCFHELTAHRENDSRTHKFVMTSNYGAGGARILTCNTLEELVALKQSAVRDLPNLALHSDIQAELSQQHVHAVKADAMVFKGIPGELIAAGGASGDAHPIILIDDANEVSAYISGAHAALREGVIEKTIQTMLAAGAQLANIQLLIGPGLGKNSYEFGSMKIDGRDVSLEEYLDVPADKVTKVQDPKKRLLDIEKIVAFKAMGFLAPQNIHNMNIDTMGFDLYEDGTRKSTVNFKELNKQGLLFFGARRKMMEERGLTAENPGLHNTVGRHFAGITLRG